MVSTSLVACWMRLMGEPCTLHHHWAHSIEHLPFWARLFAGLGLLAGASAAELVNRRLDDESLFLTIATSLLTFAGVYLLMYLLC